MPPETRPEPQLAAGEPTSTPLVAADARAEEAEIASLPIPPWATDDELVALWLHGKSPNTIREDRAGDEEHRPESRRGSPASPLVSVLRIVPRQVAP
jgi:hypothetical protein